MILILALGLLLGTYAVISLHPRIETSRRRELEIDVAVLGLIGLATIAFFWRLVLVQDVWMPAGGGDLANFLYPTYRFAAEWWRQGIWPLWNPHLFGGQPFVGDIQSGIFYPLNLLTFFVANPLGYRDLEYLSVLHYYLAGAGMYAFLRWGRLGVSEGPLSRWGSFAGAVAFEFSDLFVTHFGNYNLIASAAWLPLVILFFSRAISQPDRDSWRPASSGTAAEGSEDTSAHKTRILPRFIAVTRALPRAAVAAGLLLALSMLAGHVQAFVMVILALGLVALYQIIAFRSTARRALLLFAATLIIGLGLSAIVLVPSIEMTRASVRSAFSYEDAVRYSLPPAELVGLIVPGFFGRGPQAAWGPFDRVEVGYLGVLPLLLAALALILRRDAKSWFYGFLSLFGLVLAMGGYTILQGWTYALVPGLGQLRASARYIYLLDFGLAVLAGIGLDILFRPMDDRLRRRLDAYLHLAPWIYLIVALIAGGGAVLMLALGQGQDPSLYQRIGSAANSIWFALLLLGLSLALIMARGRGLLGGPLWGVLASALILFDLFSLGANTDIGLTDPTAAYKRQDIVDFLRASPGYYRIDSRGTGVEGAWLADTAALYGLDDVNGENPLVLSDFNRYWESVGGRDSDAYRRLAVKYVLARRATPMPANFKRVLDGASGVSVYENMNPLPRARIVYDACAVDSLEEAFALLNNPQYRPEEKVILERLDLQCTSAVPRVGTAEITGLGPNEVDIKTDDGAARFLVLSEVYYPGWRAFVDGFETGVLRADAVFRAVALTPGAHTVRFIYDPLSFKIGTTVSLVTLLSLCAWWLTTRV